MFEPMKALRFASVGAAVAALYVLFYLGFLAIGMAQVPANALAFLLAVSVQYVGQAGLTFGAKIRDGAQVSRFVAMIGCGLVTSAIITGGVGPMLGLAEWMAAVAVTLLLPVQNYIIMTRWVFRQTMDASS